MYIVVTDVVTTSYLVTEFLVSCLPEKESTDLCLYDGGKRKGGN